MSDDGPGRPGGAVSSLLTDPARLRRGVFGLFVVLVVLSAWVQDDAYITFRTVDNWVGGRGLTWNPGERVQTYTHPLWMLVHAAAYAVTGEIYLTSLGLSMVFSFLAFYLLVFRLARSPSAGLAAGLLLVTCKSFVEYSTSGLENPLTHLLIVAFALRWLRPGPPERTFPLALIACLGCLNRPDAVLLFLPALTARVVAGPSRRRRLGAMVLGFLPLLGWEVFALIYYGFPLPNPAYAKLSFGVPLFGRLVQGSYYLVYSLLNDPMTWLAAGTAAVVAGRPGGRRPCLTAATGRQERWLLAGAGLYLAYVVWVGGGYMGGRFLSAPLVVAAVVVARAEMPAPSRRRIVAALAVVCPLLVLGAAAPGLGLDQAVPSVGDERLRFYHATGLVAGWLSDRPWPEQWPDHFFRRKGEYVRERFGGDGEGAHGHRVIVDGYVGLLGFYAGPEVHVVDLIGLTDPLLARLPGMVGGPVNRPGDELAWKVGHVPRPLPRGYLETLESGVNRLADRRLAGLYDQLNLVTRGRIRDPARRRAILGFLLGRHRQAVASWAADHPEMLRPTVELDERFSVTTQEVLDALAEDP